MTEPTMMVAEPNRASTRVAALMLCLALGACNVTSSDSAPPVTDTGTAPIARTGGGSGGARGGASTAAARGTGEPVEVAPDPVVQARASCWMKVESQKALRGIDQRVAYVEKCVADAVKTP